MCYKKWSVEQFTKSYNDSSWIAIDEIGPYDETGRKIIAAVREGDEIITSGGVFGTVVALGDDTLEIEIAPGVVVTIARGAVQQRILPDAGDGLDATDDGDDDSGS